MTEYEVAAIPDRPSESAAGINDQKYNVLKSALIHLGVR